MLQLLVISADQGKAIYLRCSYCIPHKCKPGRCIDVGREDGKRKRGVHKGSFISTVSIYIVREMTDEGDEENR